MIAGDDDDFGDVPGGPSSDEDDGPPVALSDEDAFAAGANATQEPRQKQKAGKGKGRKAEATKDSGDGSVAEVSILSRLARSDSPQLASVQHT